MAQQASDAPSGKTVDSVDVVLARIPICTLAAVRDIGCEAVIEDSLMALCGPARLNTITSIFFVNACPIPFLSPRLRLRWPMSRPARCGIIIGEATGVSGTHAKF